MGSTIFPTDFSIDRLDPVRNMRQTIPRGMAIFIDIRPQLQKLQSVAATLTLFQRLAPCHPSD